MYRHSNDCAAPHGRTRVFYHRVTGLLFGMRRVRPKRFSRPGAFTAYTDFMVDHRSSQKRNGADFPIFLIVVATLILIATGGFP